MLNAQNIFFCIFLLGCLPAVFVASTDKLYSTSIAGLLILVWSLTMAYFSSDIMKSATEWLDARAPACVSPLPQPVVSTDTAPL